MLKTVTIVGKGQQVGFEWIGLDDAGPCLAMRWTGCG
jgi:hypothetical protein